MGFFLRFLFNLFLYPGVWISSLLCCACFKRKRKSIFVKQKDKDRLVVYFHGNGLPASWYMASAGSFMESTADYLFLEYPGYGNSGCCSFPKSEQDIVNACVHDIQKYAHGYKEVIYHGTSLGTAILAKVMQIVPPTYAIFENPFISTHDIVPTFIRRLFDVRKNLHEWRTEWSKLDPKIPMLFLFSSEDEQFRHFPMIHPQLSDRKIVEFQWLHGAGHNDALLHPDYQKLILEFLSKQARKE